MIGINQNNLHVAMNEIEEYKNSKLYAIMLNRQQQRHSRSVERTQPGSDENARLFYTDAAITGTQRWFNGQ